MSKDHLAKAKDYIAKGEDFYRRAAEEITAAMDEDPTLGQQDVADRIGKSRRWVRQLVQWHTSGQEAATPFSGPEENQARYERQARTILKDPERRRQALAELPAAEVEAVIEDANEVAIERLRAKRSEHDTRPTARELMGDDPFRPDEFWADNVILRVNNNARELASLIKRGGGLILGAMDVERAFERLDEAERLIAEARAAAQEQLRDRAGVS